MQEFLASLTSLAKDPAMTAEKINALAGAQKEIAAQEAEQAYTQAMNAAQRAMPAAGTPRCASDSSADVLGERTIPHSR